jgi:hypothetical protein
VCALCADVITGWRKPICVQQLLAQSSNHQECALLAVRGNCTCAALAAAKQTQQQPQQQQRLLYAVLTAVCCSAAPVCFRGEAVGAVCIAGPCNAKVGTWRSCFLIATRAEAAHSAWCTCTRRACHCGKGARGAHCVCSTSARSQCSSEWS